MIAQMNVEAQVEADFDHAHRRAFIRRVIEALHNHTTDLPAFEKLRKSLGVSNRVALAGIKTVEVEKIVGSVGRYKDFDSCFLPARSNVSARWERVDQAFLRGDELPPVSLYKVGNVYFVNDGNHRVSVARYHGVEEIDAEVVEFGSSGSSTARLLNALPNCSGLLSRLSGKLRSALSLHGRE
ncbi:MAG TPA: hypothetical protein VK869_02550 [Rubrobacteraceae bacterium]|nr:hypothetical protein [Rubrobacteraceae bacterium]